MPARYVSSLAFAGHAGEMDHPGSPVVLPFEMWLGLMGVALLLLIAIAWLVGNAFSLRKIDRRLRNLEGKTKAVVSEVRHDKEIG